MTDKLIVCVNFRPDAGHPSCAARGSKELTDWLNEQIARRGLDIKVERGACMSYCLYGPNVKIKGGRMVHQASIEKLEAVLDQFVEGAAP